MMPRRQKIRMSTRLWVGSGIIVALNTIITATIYLTAVPEGPGPWNPKWPADGLICDVVDFGAFPDDECDDSWAIQNALDFCVGEARLEDVAPPSMSAEKRAYYQWWEDMRRRQNAMHALTVAVAVGTAAAIIVWCVTYVIVWLRRRSRH